MDTRTPSTIGLFGQFDIDSLDAQVRLRIARHELSRRRPDLTIRAFAPFGSTRPVAIAADEPVEALAPVTTARLAALTAELGAIVVVGEIAAGPSYADHPSVDPRDVSAALALLRKPPPGLPMGTDPASPHPALLGRRVWSYTVCEQRREFLRAMHWWPQDEAAIVLPSGPLPPTRVAGLLDALPADSPVILLETGDHEAGFFATAEARLGTRAHRMPADRAGLEDRIAAIAGVRYVVSAQPVITAIADAFGIAWVDPTDFHIAAQPLPRPSHSVDLDVAALDAHYDALAALVVGSVRGPLVADEVAALRATLDARGRRLAYERIVLADYVRAVRNNTAAQIAATEARQARSLIDRISTRLSRRR